MATVQGTAALLAEALHDTFGEDPEFGPHLASIVENLPAPVWRALVERRFPDIATEFDASDEVRASLVEYLRNGNQHLLEQTAPAARMSLTDALRASLSDLEIEP